MEQQIKTKVQIRKMLDKIDMDELSLYNRKLCLKNACAYSFGDLIYKFSSYEIDDIFYKELIDICLMLDGGLMEDLFEVILKYSTLDQDLMLEYILRENPDTNELVFHLLRKGSPR